MVSNLLKVLSTEGRTTKLTKKHNLAFHSTRNNEMLRRFGIVVGGAAGAGYLAKLKYEHTKREANIDLNVHCHKGETAGQLDISSGKIQLLVGYNPELLKNIELSSKAPTSKGAALPSVL